MSAPPLYTPQPESKDIRTTFTVRLTPDQVGYVKLIADAWNAADAAAGVKRSRKWKPSSVVSRLIAVGIDNFFDGVQLKPPETEREREAFIRHCAELLAKSGSSSKKK
jgi:hypothetical protein